MNSRKILITGISGFLGSHFLEYKPKKYTFFGTYNSKKTNIPNTFKIDLCNSDDFEQLIEKIQPEAIVHLAANSDPNYCELNSEETHRINVEVAVKIAEIAKKRHLQYVFTSTDLVFDGECAPYSETDTPNPISIYGKQKLEAENKILEIYPDAIIARMPLMFGVSTSKHSFYESWLTKIKNNTPFKAFTDEWRSPISGKTAVKGLILLIEKKVQGIYHLAGKDRISRFNFALTMAKMNNIDSHNIVASKRADINMPALRPRDVTMKNTKASKLGFTPLSLEDEIKQYLP